MIYFIIFAIIIAKDVPVGCDKKTTNRNRGGFMKEALAITDWKTAVVVLLIAAGFVISAGGQAPGIATIVSSKGDIVLETQHVWLKNPEAGRVIYHGDKILTLRDGSVSLRFDDGSALDISVNSNVRIAQPSQKGVSADEEFGKREIRVMLGKVGYKSGDHNTVTTRMVSPTAVAALRGTEVQFGTDGIYTLLNRVEGSSDNTGNISEGHVPEITSEQAEKSPNYQSVLNASKSWEKYQEAQKSNDPKANVLLVEAVKKTDEALLLENKALGNNPDNIIRERASDGVKKSEEAIKKISEYLSAAVSYQNKIQENAEKSQKQSESKEAYQLSVKAATEAQEAVINAVKAYLEVAESHTASLYGKDAAKAEQTAIKSIEIAADMATSAEKKVDALVIKALTSKDVNVATAALKSAAIVAASAEANSAVTDLALKAIHTVSEGDKTELQKANQSIAQAMETAGTISDKALKTDTIVEKVEKAAERNDTASVKEALQEVNIVQKEVNTEIKALPDIPVITPPPTSSTPAETVNQAAQSQTTNPTDKAAMTDTVTTPSSEASLGTGGTSPSGGTETPLIQQTPPLQDVKKATVPKPYGQ